METKKVLAGILSSGALVMGGVDASTLNEVPLERVEQVAGYTIEAKQIGNTVETTLPWKDQPGIKVVYDMKEPSLADRVKDKRKEQVITELVDVGDGGFKVDILLNERPNTNRFCYAIEGAKNYDFFYQTELTQEEIDRGTTRPENVVGSYAVYHKTLQDNKIGGQNYETGKVMHIYRPEVWELNNERSTKEWAQLSYNEKDGLCVTARQEFLDNATYPVRIDPTFGYTSIGASTQNIMTTNNYFGGFSSLLVGNPHTMPANGDITNIVAYLSDNLTETATVNVKALLYNKDSIGPDEHSLLNSKENAGITVSDQWETFTFSSPYSATASQELWLLIIGDDGVPTETGIRFDTSSDLIGYSDTEDYTAIPTELTSLFTFEGASVSIYATYTAAGGGSSPVEDFWDDN